MNIRMFAIAGITAISLSVGTAQPCSAQEQVDELTRLRLSQLRSGGVALLPIDLTLTLPPGVTVPPLRLQQHLEKSMTEALLKLRNDITVIPPETTSSVLRTSPINLAGRMPVLIKEDSLRFDPEIARLLRDRTDARFLMTMSLAPTWATLSKEVTQGDADPIIVVCRIWDTDTGQMVWQAQHPWSIPAEPDTARTPSAAMRQLCAKILAQIPQ